MKDVEITPPSEESMRAWNIIVKGPDGSPYSKGHFKLLFEFPANYPFKAPSVTFITKIYHPSVKTDTGEICTDLLSDGWGPALNIRHCIEEIVNMMKNPSSDHPLEESIAVVFREKPKDFEKMAIKWTKDYAN